MTEHQVLDESGGILNSYTSQEAAEDARMYAPEGASSSTSLASAGCVKRLQKLLSQLLGSMSGELKDLGRSVAISDSDRHAFLIGSEYDGDFL